MAWVDCRAAKLMTEIGIVLGAITTGNGYSTSMVTVKYDDFALTQRVTDYPIAEVIPADIDTEDIDTETQQITFSFKILAYILLTASAEALANRKTHLEFAADIRTALLSIYARQQAGTFTMAGFLKMENINQTLFTSEIPKGLAGVFSQVDFKFDAKFTDR